jgi:hypothetical protein
MGHLGVLGSQTGKSVLRPPERSWSLTIGWTGISAKRADSRP